jgi:hypothetical protein
MIQGGGGPGGGTLRATHLPHKHHLPTKRHKQEVSKLRAMNSEDFKNITSGQYQIIKADPRDMKFV